MAALPARRNETATMRVNPSKYKWSGSAPQKVNVAYLTRSHQRSGSTLYCYRFYFGDNRWSVGFVSHRAAALHGREALEVAAGDKDHPLGLPMNGVYHGVRQRPEARLQKGVSTLGHARLLDAAHDFLYHDSWYRTMVSAGHPPHVLASVKEKLEQSIVKLREVSEYDPNKSR